MDLKIIIKFAHEHNVKVFVDEAWFGYGHFHPHFRPYSAIDCGADYITSAHKVLSAFSQASYLHVNDPDFDEDFFREIYSIYTSTSSKYQLIASLDVCHKQLEIEGFHILNRLLVYVDELKQQVSKLKNIRILTREDFIREIPNLEQENIGHDPLKILIDISKLSYSFQEIHRYFNDEIGLEIEKYTQSTFLVLLTLGGTRSKVIRLYNALKKIDDGRVKLSPTKTRKKLKEIPPIKMCESPADAFFAQREHISLVESVGRVSAGVVTPYPPGIPTIIPGQLIEQEHIDYILDMARNSILIQGMSDGLISVKK